MYDNTTVLFRDKAQGREGTFRGSIFCSEMLQSLSNYPSEFADHQLSVLKSVQRLSRSYEMLQELNYNLLMRLRKIVILLSTCKHLISSVSLFVVL